MKCGSKMKKTAWLLVLILLLTTVFPGTGMLWGGVKASAEDRVAPAFAEGYPQTANVIETSLDLLID